MEQETKGQSREEPLPAPSKKRSWLIVKLAVVLIVVITAFLLPDYVATKNYDGLYRYSIPGVEIFFEVDLRKDGTARILQFPKDSFMPLLGHGGTASLCTWKVSGDKIILENNEPVLDTRTSKKRIPVYFAQHSSDSLEGYSFEQAQAMIAVGIGGNSAGGGWREGKQKKLGYLPRFNKKENKLKISHKYIFEIEGKDIFAFKTIVLDEEGGEAKEEKIKTRQKVRLMRQ